VAIGSGTIAGKENGTEEAVAMGYRAKATGNKSMTLGFDSRAEAVNSVALGTNALVKKDAKYGINISTESGNVVSARKGMILGGANNIVKNIDDEAEGYKKRGRVIVGGHHNTVSSGDGIILGGFNNTVANANGVTLKNGNKDNRGGAIVGGHHNVVSGGDAIALGGGTSQWADGTPAPELYNEAGGENSGVLAGHGNKTYGFNSVVLGGSQNIAGDEAKRGEIERGQEKNQAVVGGSKNKALGINAIVVGGNNNVASGRNSVAMGVRSLAAGIGSLALGGLTEKKLADLINAGDYEGIVKEYKDAFSIADITELDGMSQTAEKNVFILEKVAEFQKENQGGKAYTDGSVAIGSGTIAGKENGTEEAVAMGYRAKAIKDKTLALGFDAKADHANSVALGEQAETKASVDINKAIVSGIKYGNFAGTPNGVVSIGKAGAEKQLVNVAAGAVTETSTDAINGSQLYATNIVLGNVAKSVKNNFGGDAALDEDGNITFTDIGGTGKGTIHEAIGDVKAALDTKLDSDAITSSDQSISIDTTTTAGKVDLKVNVDGTSVVLNTDGKVSVKDGGVSTEKLADGAVTEGKLADDAVTEDKIADALLTELKAKSREKVKAGDGIKVSPDTVASDTDNQEFTVSLSDTVKTKLDNLADNANATYLKVNGSNIGGDAGKATFGENVGKGVIDGETTQLVQEKAVKTYVDTVVDNIGKPKDGKDGYIGVDGKDGKNGVGIDGKDGITVKGKDGKDGVTIKGEDGANGTNGVIGLNGHDGIDGKDKKAVSADIKVVNGRPGVDGKDGDSLTRIIYEDEAGDTHTVATMDDGLAFQGDSGDKVTRKLNDTLNIK
ncbi:hypothetical protein, partial [Phocoenobacter skyensis]